MWKKCARPRAHALIIAGQGYEKILYSVVGAVITCHLKCGLLVRGKDYITALYNIVRKGD